MGSYRVSVNARTQLLAIYEYTESKYGAYQADAYYAGLERTFGLLADFPRMGASADELVIGYRRFRFQSHHIFYTEEADHVFIRALIHIGQDVRTDLFG